MVYRLVTKARFEPVPMKRVFSFCLTALLALTALLSASCQSDKRTGQLLQQADSLIKIRPDSMRTVLQAWADSMSREPEQVRMRYRLLCVKADDKAYVPHTSDSLILPLVRYYRSRRDKSLLPEALYYAGRTYSDLKDAPLALEYYQQAIDVMTQEKLTDYDLMSRIYSQMGELFIYQRLYKEAPGVIRKAYECDLILKDSASLVFDLRDIGRVFAITDQPDSAVWYYNQAAKVAMQMKDYPLRNMVYREFAGFQNKWGNYAEAYRMLQISKTTLDSTSFPPFYNNMARYFHFTNQFDSAIYYYKKELSLNSLFHKAGACEGLADIAHLRGDDALAFHLLKQHILYNDSLRKSIRTEEINKIRASYNYQKYEHENKMLRKKSFQRKIIFLASISLTLILLLAGTALWQKHKRKEQIMLLQQAKLKRMQERQFQFSQAQIASNKKKIEELAAQLHEAQRANDLLHENLLQAQKELVEKKNAQIKAIQAFSESSLNKLQQTDTWKKLHHSGNNETIHLSASEWSELKETVNAAYPEFIKRLNELAKLSEMELQVCILTKLNVPLSRIAYAVCRSRQGISSIRERLYKKLSGKKGKPKDCDDLIRNL